MTTEEFLTEFFRVTGGYDDHASWFWRMDGNRVKLFANCSDIFDWGCADGEEITPENIGQLRAAYADCKAVEGYVGTCYGAELFCARVRQMRPQGAYYEGMSPAIAALFDACGPLREVGLGNPKKHPSEVGA